MSTKVNNRKAIVYTLVGEDAPGNDICYVLRVKSTGMYITDYHKETPDWKSADCECHEFMDGKHLTEKKVIALFHKTYKEDFQDRYVANTGKRYRCYACDPWIHYTHNEVIKQHFDNNNIEVCYYFDVEYVPEQQQN